MSGRASTLAGALSGVAGLAVVVGFATSGTPIPGNQASAAASTSASTSMSAGSRDPAAMSPDVRAALASRLAPDIAGAGPASSASDRASRSSTRPALLSTQREVKHAELFVTKQEMPGDVHTVAPTDPKDIAMSMLGDYGWSSSEFSCLESLYERESGWSVTAENPYSGAYGLGQALPGSKMSVYGSDWATNPETQLKWGLAYIRDRYGSPCGAWGFWESHSWY